MDTTPNINHLDTHSIKYHLIIFKRYIIIFLKKKIYYLNDFIRYNKTKLIFEQV